MVDGVVGYNTLNFIVIVASCIHVAVKAREVGAAHLDANAVTFFKVVGGTHGLFPAKLPSRTRLGSVPVGWFRLGCRRYRLDTHRSV